MWILSSSNWAQVTEHLQPGKTSGGTGRAGAGPGAGETKTMEKTILISVARDDTSLARTQYGEDQ